MWVGVTLLIALGSFASLHAAEFLPNVGQMPPAIQFAARNSHLEMHALANGSLVFRPRIGQAITLAWNGAAPVRWAPGLPTGNRVRFCNPGTSLTACTDGGRTYSTLRQNNLYPGIDLVLHSSSDRFEYDLEIRPGGKVDDIQLQIKSSEEPVVDSASRILAGGIAQWRPIAYQHVNGVKTHVECSIRRISPHTFGFVTGPHRQDLALVIDPVVESSTTASTTEGAEDRIIGGGTGLVFGVTKQIGRTDWDVFVSHRGVTTYWGGSGDEQIFGFDFDPNNSTLTLAGATASSDAPVLGVQGRLTSFHGGATDGFVVQWSGASIVDASFLGGPGADAVNDVRRVPTVTGFDGLIFAAETDNPEWAGFQVDGAPRGGTDAVVGMLSALQASLLVAGGPGDDTAKSIRRAAAAPDVWFVGGETDSPGFAGKTGPGRDVWVARLSTAPLRLFEPKSWGGSGDDRLAGLGIIPDHGVMLAGTTGSTDLPGARELESEYQGGNSDGYVAWLEPITLMPVRTRYIGGAGADEILAIRSYANDLLLVGVTDSAAIAPSGPTPTADAAGGQDGLFVQTDAYLNPLAVYRSGGSGNDRFTSVEPKATGMVELSGWSESAEWLSGLDLFPNPLGKTAGFLLQLRYAMVATSSVGAFGEVNPPLVITVGRDMKVSIPVLVSHEPDSDGILIARSADPSKLRIAGEAATLLYRPDRPGSQNSLVLEALAETGDVEVIISGRSASPSSARYPERRIRVRPVPSRAFFASPSIGQQTVVRGIDFTVTVAFAQLQAEGTPGPIRELRDGFTAIPNLTVSDPSIVTVLSEGPNSYSPGVYTFRLRALRDGEVVLGLQSTGIPAAPDQQLRVRVAGPDMQQSQWNRRVAVPLDHTGSFIFELAPGDQLRFTSEDSQGLRLEGSGIASTTGVIFVGPGSKQMQISPLQAGPPIGVQVEGTVRGNPINERLEVLPWNYSLTFLLSSSLRIPLGSSLPVYFGTSPLSPLPSGVTVPPLAIRKDSPLTSAPLRLSNPDVLQAAGLSLIGNGLNTELRANRLGRTTVTVGTAEAPLGFLVDVVPPTVNFGKTIRLVSGARVEIGPFDVALPTQDWSNLKLRVSDPQLFTLEWFDAKGPAITVDLRQRYSVLLRSTGPIGKDGVLYVSTPSIPEFQVPIRVLEKIFLPTNPVIRAPFEPASPDVRVELSFSAAAFDSSSPFNSGDRIKSLTNFGGIPQKVRFLLEPSGICEVPPEAEVPFASFSVRLLCRNEGTVTLKLLSDGLSPEQGSFAVRVTTFRPAAAPLFKGTILSLAKGTQSELTQFRRAFAGTYKSSDPDRVKLSTSPTQPGRAEVATSLGDQVFVQGLSSDGMAWITATSQDGNQSEIPVFLYPATMAVRTERDPTASQLLMTPDQLTVNATVGPYAFDPATGFLIYDFPNLGLLAGTDPFFLKPQSSDESAAAPAPPNPLFSESDMRRPVSYRINGKGAANLTVEQPPGFLASPHSALRLSVVERALQLIAPAIAPGLQTNSYIIPGAFPAGVDSRSNSSGAPPAITVTSLDPGRLLLSESPLTLGVPSLSTTTLKAFVLQVLPQAQPGERLRLRLTSPGFIDTNVELPVSPAELRWANGSPLGPELPPGVDSYARFQFGPADPLNGGRIQSNWTGFFMPGSSLELRAQVSDGSVLFSPGTLQLEPNGYGTLPLRGLRPGTAELLITAPEGVVNRVERTSLRVAPWEFSPVAFTVSGARGLWAPFIIRNPRDQQTTVTVQSAGRAPLGFASNVSALPVSSLQVTLPPRGQSTIYWTALATGANGALRLSASDFADRDFDALIYDPIVRFQADSPLSLAVANKTVSLGLRLQGREELPLATAPLQIEVRSSDPRILRVVSSPVEFKTGQSVANVNVEILAPGTVTLTAVPPANFNPPGQTAANVLTVTIR